MSELLPPRDEAWKYAVGPGSITWRRAGDARGFTGAGAALLLQVAHPTIAGGVRELSDFKTDPWGRLLRTLDYVNLLVYGGPETAAATGAAMREMHKRIRGIDPQGRRYNALEPRAYAWVHATLAYTIHRSQGRFGKPLTAEQTERFWQEWRGLGRLLGIRERDLPDTWAEFLVYVEDMIANDLEDNDVVRDVLLSVSTPAPSPVKQIGTRTWKTATAPAHHVMRLSTIALIPASLRDLLDLHLTRTEVLELRAIGRASRAATPLMPGSLRTMGPGYLKWRHGDIAHGNFAGARDATLTPAPTAAPAAAA